MLIENVAVNWILLRECSNNYGGVAVMLAVTLVLIGMMDSNISTLSN